MVRGVIFLFAAVLAVALAAPKPDPTDDATRTSNGLPTSYGVPVSGQAPVPSTAIVFEPVSYENIGYGVQQYDYIDELEKSVFAPFSAVAGYKVSAVGFVVKALGWLLVHSWAIILGVVGTFAFCKFTHVCDLTYKKFASEHIQEYARSLMTPERIASASKMLEDAVHKYSSEKKKKA